MGLVEEKKRGGGQGCGKVWALFGTLDYVRGERSRGYV